MHQVLCIMTFDITVFHACVLLHQWYGSFVYFLIWSVPSQNSINWCQPLGVVCIPPQPLVRTYSGGLLYPGMTMDVFLFAVPAYLLMSQPLLDPDSPCAWKLSQQNIGMYVHLNKHFPLFSFKLACLHLFNTCSNLTSWSLAFISNIAIRISSAMPKTLGISLNNLPTFFWNIMPAGVASKL